MKTKIRSDWPRIAGLHLEGQGDIAIVWLSHDKEANRLHLYDCAVFSRVELAVIADGISSRGDRIPIAWEKSAEEVVEKLRKRRVLVLEEGYRETPALAEVNSRDIEAMMETHQFRVSKNNADNWLTEARSFYRGDGQVPQEGFPLMSATRHAFQNLDRAVLPRKSREKLPEVSWGGSVV